MKLRKYTSDFVTVDDCQWRLRIETNGKSFITTRFEFRPTRYARVFGDQWLPTERFKGPVPYEALDQLEQAHEVVIRALTPDCLKSICSQKHATNIQFPELEFSL